jgi:hypothetical protein
MTEEDYCEICRRKAEAEYRQDRERRRLMEGPQHETMRRIYQATVPPGTLRMAHCAICGGNYYGSEAAHLEAFHGRRRDECRE